MYDYYVTGDSSLGVDVKFLVPSDVPHGALIVRNGKLFNTTSETIYLYSEAYPTYSFRLPPMSGLEYRRDTYSYSALPLSVEQNDLSLHPSIFSTILCIGLLVISVIIICRGGSRRA